MATEDEILAQVQANATELEEIKNLCRAIYIQIMEKPGVPIGNSTNDRQPNRQPDQGILS